MLQMRQVSEGFAVSFTACVPLVLKFTLQIADVLYCIFKPTIERLATSFYFETVLCFVMVQKRYCNKDYRISFNLTCFSLGSIFFG